MFTNYFVIFFISLFCITLELFFTRILNLKTWNHVVYVIIPFAMLGYGIGANIYLIFKKKFDQFNPTNVLAKSLLKLGLTSLFSASFLMMFPIQVNALVHLANLKSIFMLAVAYTAVMVPFIFIGFLVTYLCSIHPFSINRLYFFDLLGAGAGAVAFFFLINTLAVFRSILLLAFIAFALFFYLTVSRHKKLIALSFLTVALISLKFIPEPSAYSIDMSKGWEWIPGYYKTSMYQTIFSKWHPLGRTEIYRFTDPAVRKQRYETGLGTFQVNLDPLPEFSYFATNTLSGTPVYKYSAEGLNEFHSQVKLFSQAMEVPYTILNKPKLVVIGTGGGRDIFMGRTHDVESVVGAEINPAVYSQMSPGGKLYDYSGRVYTQPNVSVYNIDGRHLVKKLKPNNYDLIILNGVDTFSGLSSGAYAYAESYLYTKDAVVDYLRILKDGGMINFNRWFFPDLPREDLRLLAICLDALKESGASRPWENIMMGAFQGWLIMLVKKTPFTTQERDIVKKYFHDHGTDFIFPTRDISTPAPPPPAPVNYYDLYAEAFMRGITLQYAHMYPYDISVITDDQPFFYKYYKFNFKIFPLEIIHHTGTIIFLVQEIVFFQAFVFILLFILLPLFRFKLGGIKTLAGQALGPFILYFSCLGLGFMFIEIILMQRFTLLLGSPIHAISVTLAALLIFSGFGSLLWPHFKKIANPNQSPLTVISLLLSALLILFVLSGTKTLDAFLGLDFIGRVSVVCVALFPVGLCLGMFFPAGLEFLQKNHTEAIAWAWGINCGFSVLGSMLAIILAQAYGFNAVLMIAVVVYLTAILAFRRMEKTFSS